MGGGEWLKKSSNLFSDLDVLFSEVELIYLLTAHKHKIETQGRRHQKSKTGISGPEKRTSVLPKFKTLKNCKCVAHTQRLKKTQQPSLLIIQKRQNLKNIARFRKSIQSESFQTASCFPEIWTSNFFCSYTLVVMFDVFLSESSNENIMWWKFY